MSQAFSLYLPRDSGLHRLHPLTKLMLALFLLVCGLALPGIWAGYIAFAVLVLPLALWGGVLRPLLRAVVRSVVPFAISLFLIQGFLWPQGTPILELGPVSLKLEGLLFAIRSTGRILMVVSSFLLLALTTRPDALALTLSQRGVPKSLTYIVVSTLQIVPRFQTKAATILDAQQSRGLEIRGSLRKRARALVPLIAPLVLSSLVDIEERAMALEARAFSRQGPKTALLVLHDTRWQQAARWLLAAAALAVILVRLFVR